MLIEEDDLIVIARAGAARFPTKITKDDERRDALAVGIRVIFQDHVKRILFFGVLEVVEMITVVVGPFALIIRVAVVAHRICPEGSVAARAGDLGFKNSRSGRAA